MCLRRIDFSLKQNSSIVNLLFVMLQHFRNMKSLLHIENQYFKEYQEKSKTLSSMYEKLESYDLIVTGERSFSSNHMRMNFEEDDSDLEEDIINHWSN